MSLQSFCNGKKLIMPTNLNALIRYKQIDACLKNQYVKCTIERLQEACSESMGEFRGIYKLVSERTIRDDIRVMRSNILGFNAPIEFEDGRYIYSDKEYSIFNTPVTEVQLLKDILKILLEERNNIADSEIDRLLLRISIIVGEPLPFEMKEDKSEKIHTIAKKTKSDVSKILYSMGPPKQGDAMNYRSPETTNIYHYLNKATYDKNINTLLLWDEIFSILGA